MFKKTITYKDFNDVERTEDFYFNLSMAELSEMEASADGGLSETIEKIVNSKDTKEIVKLFKELILKSYGEKSADGRRFMKSEEISKAFEETNAYSDLFMELSTDSDEATKFVNGIMPKQLSETNSVVPVK